jgi:hypothetical protein
MNFMDTASLTLPEYFQSVGNVIFSHRNYNKIIEDDTNMIVFPCPSSSVLDNAIKSINEFDSSFYVLHTAHYTGHYSLVLTKFGKKLYKVFYVHNENNDVSYSYCDYE